MNQSSTPKRRLQISISLMMLLMVIFAVISAGLFYASRIPTIRNEISMMVHGEVVAGSEDNGRASQIVFIMFTLCSPLLLAGVLSTGMSVLNWYSSRK